MVPLYRRTMEVCQPSLLMYSLSSHSCVSWKIRSGLALEQMCIGGFTDIMFHNKVMDIARDELAADKNTGMSKRNRHQLEPRT
jgi:hypothetical protein